MIETRKPATGATVTGFVGVTGGVMNCLNNTTSPINNQAISTTPAPIVKVIPLLNKPLRCCLLGLLNKLNQRDDADTIDQSIVDSVMTLLNELPRLDPEVTYG